MNLIVRANHSSLWDLGKHLAVLEKIESEKIRRRGVLTWKLEISHLSQALVLLPSPAVRHAVGVFSSLNHGQVTPEIWDQNQLFSTGQITGTAELVLFWLLFPPPHPLVYLLISPRDIVYQMHCYYTEEDLAIPSFSAAHF